MSFSTSYSYSAINNITAYLYFGREPISPFSIKVQINPAIRKYY